KNKKESIEMLSFLLIRICF
ncbi:PBP superfamily domain protein, partial [Vibrio parahaemolyticus V-223/04]